MALVFVLTSIVLAGTVTSVALRVAGAGRGSQRPGVGRYEVGP